MQRTLAILSSAVVLCLAGTQVLQACGDKFLLIGPGASFRKAYAAIHPASILLYAEPQFGASAALRDKDFQRDLTLAGHKVTLVSTESDFQKVLGTTKVDLVLVDYAAAERVAQYASTTPYQPSVMEVMTAEQAKRLQPEQKQCLKSSDRPERYLARIDDAMKTRLEQARNKR